MLRTYTYQVLVSSKVIQWSQQKKLLGNHLNLNVAIFSPEICKQRSEISFMRENGLFSSKVTCRSLCFDLF